ncbi:MAG: alpha/beta hydrolase-fold protein [Ilumatobacteraceae bacterium]
MEDSSARVDAVQLLQDGARGPVITPVGDGKIDVTFGLPRPHDGGQVLMISGFVKDGASPRRLPPAPGTDMVARTWRLPDDYLGTYLFWLGQPGLELPETFDELLPLIYSAGHPIPDPSNPETFTYPVDPENPGPPFVQSIVRGPAALADEFATAPLLGALTEHRVASTHMSDERRVWVHESTGITPDGPPPALMVVFDGGIYAHLMHTPEIVDALVAAGEFPPLVTLYCHYSADPARNPELMCREDFAAFIVDELLPWAAARWSFTSDPARTIVAGSSLGGLSSMWMAYRHPERFGNVIAQSPSAGWHPNEPAETGYMTQRWAQDGPRAVHFYVEMGEFERGAGPDGRSGYEHTQDFVAALRTHGNDVDYQDFCGGHDYLNWRATFPRALRSLARRFDRSL